MLDARNQSGGPRTTPSSGPSSRRPTWAVGTTTRYSCVDPLTTPWLSGSGVLMPCQPICNPLAPNCGDDQGCYPLHLEDRFVCMPAFEPPVPALAECSFDNDCTPGTACLDGDRLPTCTAVACCAPFCSTSTPDCPGGTACEPWYEDDAAPPGFADLGVCR